MAVLSATLASTAVSKLIPGMTAVSISPRARGSAVCMIPVRPCYPRIRFSPGRVRVVFSRDAFPQPPKVQSSSSSTDQPQPSDPQHQTPDASEGQKSSASGAENKQSWSQGEQQQWSKEWGCEGGWKSDCGPWGTSNSAYYDMLSPWFPRDNRSLEEMLNSVDRMLGSMVGSDWTKWAAKNPGWKGRKGMGGMGNMANNLMSLAFSRPWDVRETPEAYILSFDLPGLSKEDVVLRVDADSVMYIMAEKKEEAEAEGTPSRRIPRKFQTQLQLPKNINRDGVRAEMKDGVLVITVPKVSPEDPLKDAMNVPIM